jgi:hypothetical protein
MISIIFLLDKTISTLDKNDFLDTQDNIESRKPACHFWKGKNTTDLDLEI